MQYSHCRIDLKCSTVIAGYIYSAVQSLQDIFTVQYSQLQDRFTVHYSQCSMDAQCNIIEQLSIIALCSEDIQCTVIERKDTNLKN